MPIVGVHACVLKPMGDFQADTIRTIKRDHNGKPYNVLVGRPKGQDTTAEHSYHYDVGTWTADAARSHCGDHKGTFESAKQADSLPALYEMRYCPMAELRITEENGKPLIVGYAAVFDSLSEPILGSFREKIAKGAFAKYLATGADVRGLFHHEPTMILGRRSAGTLRVKEDDTGLYTEIFPPDTQLGRDIVASIKRGDITGQSFSFLATVDQWEQRDGEQIRTLIEASVFDVGPTAFPAYLDTTVAVRSLEKWKASLKKEDIPKDGLDLLRMRLKLIDAE